MRRSSTSRSSTSTRRLGAVPSVLAGRRALASPQALVLLALGALLLFPGLGRYPLLDPSEGRPATIARQMDLHRSWLVPVLHGERYDDKPAPFYWLLWATSRLPLRPETSARLPSALATLATVVVLHRFARRRLGDVAALVGGVVYLTSPAIVALGRFGTQDALLAFLVTAATISWLAWIERPRSTPWGAFALMGVGSLVKGPVAMVLPLLVAGACAAARGVLRDRVRRAGLVRGLGLSTAILLAWLAPAAVAAPEYVHALFVDHHLRRYLTGGVGHPEPPWFLVPALLAMLLPWSLVLPALAAGRRRSRSGSSGEDRHPTSFVAADAGGEVRERRTDRDLLLWAGVVVVFFSIGQAKLATYVLPAIPPLALWIGARLARLGLERCAPALAEERQRGPADGIAAAAPAGRAPLRLALGLWAAALSAAPIGAWIHLRLEFPHLASSAALAWPLPLVAAAGLWLAWREPQRLRGTVLVFAAGNVVVVLIGYLLAAPVVSRIASDAAIARAATAWAPGVPIVGFRIQPSSLAFYASAPVSKLKEVEDVLRRAREGPLLLVAREKGAAALRRAGLELHRWVECARHCLYATTPPPALSIGRLDTDRGPPS